ncbi:diguanylate cyclase [Motilibacter sp. E257]|uniref:Diguanylate cyclase n=1 Tax=Motilibacter deserti TaxID=2714956 RepID=A0ABX0GQR1_9ACTN|nr:sensor domain-containing diguanylate cyclase [Motilibacter deserti]NHC12820.1 diguanylate cyclase [Motilibacter deserti]
MEREYDVPLTALRSLYRALGRVGRAQTLRETLQAVVDGVVEGVGFEVAALSILRSDGMFETLAVAGPRNAREALLGRVQPSDAYDREFSFAEPWGALRFVPHDRVPPELLEVSWIPDIAPPQQPGAWHPLDALFAPLYAAAGELLGMLSVDLPRDGRRPGPVQRELLELFATQAGVALANASLAEQLRENQERLAASEEAFRLAFDGAGVGMAMVEVGRDGPARFLRVNEQLARITGYAADELCRMRPEDLVAAEDRAAEAATARRLLASAADGPPADAAVRRREVRWQRAAGDGIWVAVTTTLIRSASGGALYALDQVEDVTDRHLAEAELDRRARQDPLTGLANRASLYERLAGSLQLSTTGDRRGAVLFCDLDGFKAVNDNHGHEVGDRVLRAAAHRIAAEVRDTDVVGRLGGDEFVVVADDVDEADAIGLAERIRAALAEPIVFADNRADVTVSIGIAVYPEQGHDVETLLRHADTAMYKAKAAGRNAYAVYGR